MAWLAAYAVLLGALFVRFQDPDAPRRVAVPPAFDEPFGLIRWHHRAVYTVLAAAPMESLLTAARPGGRWLGLALMAGGVWLYRRAGAALGGALSPFVSPVAGADVVCAGPYRRIRHPMYLGQLLLVLGAPLLVGARISLLLTVAAGGIIVIRMCEEERRLRARLPGYDRYMAGTKRLVPWLL